MSKIDLKIKAAHIGLDLEKMGEIAEREFNQAISDVAHAVHANIVAQATQSLSGLRQEYLKSLSFDKIGDNSYVIGLEGEWANKIEDGFPAYDMRATLLQSNKTVEVGSRSGQPWVQTGAQKQKYAHVPFEHKPFSREPKAQNLAAAIKQLQARNSQGRKQKMTQVFRDPGGRPLSGKVAKVDALSLARTESETGLNLKNLDGLVKYQKVYKNKKGKETTQSIYMTYRTISELGKGFQHPGYKGLKAFPEAEQAANAAIDQIIKTFAK